MLMLRIGFTIPLGVGQRVSDVYDLSSQSRFLRTQTTGLRFLTRELSESYNCLRPANRVIRITADTPARI